MKNSRTCPKCESTDVILIPGNRMTYDGQTVLVAPFGLGALIVSRYLCVTCGYSEEWVDTDADRQKLKQKHA